MKALLALAALALAAPTPAPIKTGLGTPYFDGLPPERYVHEGAVVVLFVGDVEPFCGKAPKGLHVIACTKGLSDGSPVIIMPHPMTFGRLGDWYARILAHELAHANGGWGGDHPA